MNMTVAPQKGLTTRLGLIVILAGTLYYVMKNQSTEGAGSAVSLIVQDVISHQLDKLQSPDLNSLLETEGAGMSLAELIEHNPFQQPGSIRELSAAQQPHSHHESQKTIPATPPEICIQAIMPGCNGLMIMVENEIYGVGDTLPCGAIVAKVDASMVRFRWPDEQKGEKP